MNQLNFFHNRSIPGSLFCSKANALLHEIRAQPGGRERLRMRKTNVEKKLIEEILPIARFVQVTSTSPQAIRVKWLNGNQNYDATLKNTATEEPYYIEVTLAVHPNDYLAREHINNRNVVLGLDGLSRCKKTGAISSAPTVHHGQQFVHDFAEIVRKTIAKKAGKKYPERTTLLVECNLNTLYDNYDWNLLVDCVEANMPSHQFQNIFLCDPIHNHHAVIR